MKPRGLPGQPDALNEALDVALARALRPPVLRAGFRVRLNAMLARAGEGENTAATHARLERERREGLAELEGGYLRLRRRTLGTLVGAAFAAGAGLALLLPWVKATFGAEALWVVAALGVAVGFVLAGVSCLGRSQFGSPLERLSSR